MMGVHETRHAGNVQLPMHRHAAAYAALILTGRYTEAGPDGLWSCGEGDLVLHPPFHLHADRFERAGARVLNVELPFSAARTLNLDRYAVVQPRDPDRLVRLASRSPSEALGEALEDARVVRQQPREDWLGRFAERLVAQPGVRIGVAANDLGISAEHASREFTKRFGLGPAVYRAEQRMRRVLRHMTDVGRSLSDIAVEAGYADQAHMTRATHAATGASPTQLRRMLTA